MQQFYHVPAELLGGDGTEPGPDHETEGAWLQRVSCIVWAN